MDRRAALSLGLIMPLLATDGAEAAPAGGPPIGEADSIRVWRIHADGAGESHIERITLRAPRKALPVASVLVNSYRPAKNDWHHAPYKTFTINMTGELEVELSDGKRQRIGPGELVYLEDLTGKGHVTRLLTPVANLFLRMPDDFDLLAWASGA